MPDLHNHIKFTQIALGKEVAKKTEWVHIYLDDRLNHRAYHNYDEVKKVQSLYGDIAGLVCALHIVLDESKNPDILMDWVKEKKETMKPRRVLNLTEEQESSLQRLVRDTKNRQRFRRDFGGGMPTEGKLNSVEDEEEIKGKMEELGRGMMRILKEGKANLEEGKVEIE